jgi:23S rRNA (cytosine1962-C5)-methyltransferase
MREMNRLSDLLAVRVERLPPDTCCFRWVDGELDGITVDLFDDVAVVSLYRELDAAEEHGLAQALVEARPLRAVYVKRRPREARRPANEDSDWVAPRAPLLGQPVASLVSPEHGARFEIRPDNGLSVGLYLDARDARAEVRRLAKGRRVLNTFAYTCAFGVVAHLGGASRVANLDVSRRVLDWGEVNYAHNHLDAQRFDFISGDVFEWLARFRKKDEVFDLIILDPPGFSTARGRRFTAQRDYHHLVATAAKVLSRSGLLVAMCNVEAMSEAELLGQLTEGLVGTSWKVVSRVPPSAIDFREGAGLKCLVVEVS